jgi:hypothetical protein
VAEVAEAGLVEAAVAAVAVAAAEDVKGEKKMSKKNNGRFEIVTEQSISLTRGVTVLLDRETGVNYLFYQSGYSGGLTPLLDRDGKPVVSTVYGNFTNTK